MDVCNAPKPRGLPRQKMQSGRETLTSLQHGDICMEMHVWGLLREQKEGGSITPSYRKKEAGGQRASLEWVMISLVSIR